MSRTLPTVSADGSIEELAKNDFSQDQHNRVSRSIAGLASDAVIAVCTPLPDRLLLFYSIRTQSDVARSIRTCAKLGATLASLPAFFLAALFWRYAESITLATLAFGLPVAGAALFGHLKCSRREKPCETTAWIDFQNRMWKSQERTSDEKQPIEFKELPFDSLILICVYRNWEQGATYEVGLFNYDTLDRHAAYTPQSLNWLQSFDTEVAALDFAALLGALWGVPVLGTRAK